MHVSSCRGIRCRLTSQINQRLRVALFATDCGPENFVCDHLKIAYSTPTCSGGVVAKARKEVELAVRVGNEPGAFDKVLAAIASPDVHGLAYCTYAESDDLVILLVTDNAVVA